MLTATVALVIGLTAPVIPDNLKWIESYEYVCIGHMQQVIGLDSVWRDPEYTPEPCTGNVAISMFDDGVGNHVYQQIPLQQYHNMALVGGHNFNPTKEAFKSILETYLLAPTPVQAAVLRGTLTSVNGSGTSLTFATTVSPTSTNNILFVSGLCNGTAGDSVSSITYNGVAAKIVTLAITANNSSFAAGYLINPNPNTNNVVVSCTAASAGNAGKAINYGQAYQSSVDGIVATPVSTASTTVYNTINVSAPGAYHVAAMRWDTGAAITWVGCSSLQADGGYSIVDSGALPTIGSQFCGGTSSGSNSVAGIGIAIWPSASDFSTF